MKGFVLERYDDDVPARLTDVPVPQVGPHDVLVRVVAAGVNPLDSKIAQGEFRIPLPYRLPVVLGNDVAGVVERVGSAVDRFEVGDRVFARPDKDRIGTFAEYVAVAQHDLARVPDGLGLVEAASLPLVALTAWQVLVERADVRPGQRVLVHAGAGGVGSIAIQLAKHLGAEVITTGSATSAELLRSLGADRVVDYRTEDVTEVVRDVDVVLDPLGPASVLTSLSLVRPGGLVVSIQGPPDPPFARYLGRPWLAPVFALLSLRVRLAARRRRVRYSFLFMRADGAQLSEIGALVEAGALRPLVERTFPFARTLEAMRYVDSGRTKGKVVVTLDDPTSSDSTHSTDQKDPS